MLSAIIGRIIVMVTKVNNEGDDKPWVLSTKEIINDPISALQWLTFLKRITVWVLEVRMKMLLLRKRGGRYDNDNDEERKGVDDDEIFGGMSRRLLFMMRRARKKNISS